jgi:CP family cyanate transporter-like MFS transporter
VRAQTGRSSSGRPGPSRAGSSPAGPPQAGPPQAGGSPGDGGSGAGRGGAGRRGLQAGGAGLLIAGILALAANMRAAITSLPPLFPQLHGALHLSPAGQAVLAAIPVLCFGVFSGSGAPLARRFGEERVLGAALVTLAAGLALRAADPGVLLFPGTIVAGGSIALLNVLTPSLVKRRQPERAGLLIGLYLLALSAGAIVASLIAVPVFQAAGGGAGSVRLTVGLWAVPALLAAALWAPQLRFRTVPGPAAPGPAVPDAAAEAGLSAEPASPATRRAPAALWRSALTWQVTAFMGLQSLGYYAALSWFPTLFQDRGASAVHAGTLLAIMGLGNAITALAVPALAHRLRDQRLLSAVWMVGTGIGLAGAAFAPLGAAPAFMLLLGAGQGASLGLAIFYTVARSPDPVTSASLSGFAQSLGYLVASTGPLLLGFLHTATGGWDIPVDVLLAVVALQLVTGWLAGRDQTIPPVPRAS